jgi:16S rRNA G966 N2-methylase RsmD
MKERLFVLFFRIKQIVWMFRYETLKRSIPQILFQVFVFPVWRMIGGRAVSSTGALYAWLRYIDNLIDGDLPFLDEENISEYVHERLLVVETKKPFRQEDRLFLYALQRTPERAQEIVEATTMILQGIASEWERKKLKILSSFARLSEEARLLGEGTMRSFAFIFISPPYNNALHEVPFISKGTPQWIDWMSGTVDDLKKGIVTIPEEVAREAGLTFEMLTDIKSWKELLSYKSIRKWFEAEFTRFKHQFEEFDLRHDFEKLYGKGVLSRLWKWIFYDIQNRQLRFLSRQLRS